MTEVERDRLRTNLLMVDLAVERHRRHAAAVEADMRRVYEDYQRRRMVRARLLAGPRRIFGAVLRPVRLFGAIRRAF